MSTPRSLHPEARKLRERIVAADKRHVWHPYTPMDRYIGETQPLVIARASGSRLFDLDGRSFIDGNSSWWVSLLGHNHPRLLSTLAEQSQRLCHTALAGITHEPAALLAEELCAVAPEGLSRVFYSDDGSTAVELAIKMCLQYWAQNGRPERRRFLALSDAFHGETLGVTALGGVEVFRKPFAGALMECVHVPPGTDGHAQAFDALSRTLSEQSHEIAACVVEPILQGAGGMRMYDPQFLRHLREVTAQHDVFLVIDEVFTGYGRTGPMWASEHAAIEPDVMCVAKGFTAGVLPMAATLATERIFEGFLGADDRALFYGHTYCGHPLGAAIAREVLAIYRDERVLERIVAKAERIADMFERLGQIDGVSDARSLGMMGALNIGSDGGYLERAGWQVYEKALQLGAYVRPLGNVVYVAPAVNIPDADLDELLSIVEQATLAVCRGE